MDIAELIAGSQSILTLILKFTMTILISGVIGYNRGSKNQVAGIKTHILVAIGALISVLVPLNYETTNEIYNVDPFRLSAQVVSGIGFLGAGTIIKTGNYIRGLTTAASLWTIAIVSISIGAGYYSIAIVSFIAIFAVLKFSHKIAMFSKEKFMIYNITVRIVYTIENEKILRKYLNSLGISNNNIFILSYKSSSDVEKMTFKVDVKLKNVETEISDILEHLSIYKFIDQITFLNEHDKIQS